jgi:spermidine/putrescine transport system substrate-binding protein
MNRRAFILAGGAVAACATDRRPRLNVYNWSTYIDPAMVALFEAERGVRVRYGTYESNEEMLAKAITGNSGWDVVFPTHSRLAPMARNGLLAKLDHGRLPSLGNLDARFTKPVWDPELAWGVPYMWNATGIAYNRAQTEEPKRWSALWSPALSGRITMLDDPEDVIGACLQKLSFPFDSVDATQLHAARAEAIRQKRLLRAYLNAEVRDQLVAGDVLAAQLWSTTTAQAMHADPKIGFCYPEEGFPLYCDCAAILRESHRTELAHEFLDFLLRPQVAAANAKASDTATANGAANVPRDPVLYPPDEIYVRGMWPPALPSAAQRYRDRASPLRCGRVGRYRCRARQLPRWRGPGCLDLWTHPLSARCHKTQGSGTRVETPRPPVRCRAENVQCLPDSRSAA